LLIKKQNACVHLDSLDQLTELEDALTMMNASEHHQFVQKDHFVSIHWEVSRVNVLAELAAIHLMADARDLIW